MEEDKDISGDDIEADENENLSPASGTIVCAATALDCQFHPINCDIIAAALVSGMFIFNFVSSVCVAAYLRTYLYMHIIIIITVIYSHRRYRNPSISERA